MKKTIAAPTKKGILNFISSGDDKKDIEILKKSLLKKEKQERANKKIIDNYSWDLREANSLLIFAKKRIFDLEQKRKANLETMGIMVESLELSSKSLCNILQSDSSNLFPQDNYDLILELKNAVKLFSSLAHSTKNDLLKSENIQEFLNFPN